MSRIQSLAKAALLGGLLATPITLAGAGAAAATPASPDFRICGTGPWGHVQACINVDRPGWYADRYWDGGGWRDHDNDGWDRGHRRHWDRGRGDWDRGRGGWDRDHDRHDDWDD